MRMRSRDRRHLAIEVVTHCNGLAGRLCMKIDKNDLNSLLLAKTQRLFFNADKRIFEWRVHKSASLTIDHSDLSLFSLQHYTTAARSSLGVINRTQKARFGGKIIDYFLLIPYMIS